MNPEVVECLLPLNTKNTRVCGAGCHETWDGFPPTPQEDHLQPFYNASEDLTLTNDTEVEGNATKRTCIGTLWDKKLLTWTFNPSVEPIEYLDPLGGYVNWYHGSDHEVHPLSSNTETNKHITTEGAYLWEMAPPFSTSWADEESLKFRVVDPRQSDENVYPMIPPAGEDIYWAEALPDFENYRWRKNQINPCPSKACSTSNFLTVEYGVRWANHTQCDEGMTGYMCQACIEGWSRNEQSKHCETCEGTNPTIALMSAISTLLGDLAKNTGQAIMLAMVTAQSAESVEQPLHSVILKIMTNYMVLSKSCRSSTSARSKSSHGS
jgi:hypothetical protein